MGGQKAFGLKYKDIALSSANGKNEVALEFSEDAKKATTGDILCEMRFHVPNNELEIYQQEQDKAKAERRAEKKKAAGDNPEEKKGEADEEESSSDEGDDGMTAAKLLNQKIH